MLATVHYDYQRPKKLVAKHDGSVLETGLIVAQNTTTDTHTYLQHTNAKCP